MEILVIGAGASGMMAALTAAESSENRVTLLERQARPGRKLLATGNGRCNLTNLHADARFYHTETPALLHALTAFDTEQTLEYFASLGLVTAAEDSGRVYPFSDSANSVADVLRFALARAGVRLCCGTPVTALRRTEAGFAADTPEGVFRADRVILACGGPAGGKLGGTGDGHALLRALGHPITALTPSLVQLKTDPVWVRSLKGVRTEAGVRLLRGETELASSRGEVQFTEYGVSGPAIFDVSRAAARHAGDCAVVLDLLPPRTEDGLLALLDARVRAASELTMENFLTGVLHNRLGRTVLRAAGFRLDMPVSALTAADLDAVCRAVKAFRLPVTGTMGFENAQVTAGGASGGAFDPVTLESRLVPGLFVCGEVLDVDGDCGGYNLQWAWSSGRVAGRLGREA